MRYEERRKKKEKRKVFVEILSSRHKKPAILLSKTEHLEKFFN